MYKKSGSGKYSNQRRHVRFGAQSFSDVIILLSPVAPFFGETIEGRLSDLSCSGMAISIREFIPSKTQFQLDLTFPDKTHLSSKVIIRRTAKQEEGYTIGMEFLGLEDGWKAKIDKMAKDYLACEKRIAENSQPVCQPNCGYFSNCTKPHRQTPSEKTDGAIHIKLGHPAAQ